MDKIRNFSIIAHIDHGKSTLADRFLERGGLVVKGEQILDSMELERDRGITIRAHPVSLDIEVDGVKYLFNLIDTPGHVDFSYEVSRSLKACEGAILLVDATQGVEAQTIANTYLALENDLVIIPVINKIDVKDADIEGTSKEIVDILGFKEDEILKISAKTGEGVDNLIKAILERIPAPHGDPNAPLKALVFDSHFDTYKGVVVYVRIKDGTIKKGDKIKFMSNGKEFEVEEVGIFRLKMEPEDVLSAGSVGYFTALIRDPLDVQIGDTVTHANNPTKEPIPGFRKNVPMVFAGIFPLNTNEFEELKKSLEKLHLNDPAFTFEPESSEALGFGFRCGFSGLLHMEITIERLRIEFGQDIIATVPNVEYEIVLRDGRTITIDNPAKFPDPSNILEIREPIVDASIMIPPDYIGNVMELITSRRAVYKEMLYPEEKRVIIRFEVPLQEIITDFFDTLKSVTRGYGTLDYEFIGFKKADIVKVDILINKKPIDALSFMAHEEKAYYVARSMLEKMRKVIPRQMFEISLQAAIGSKIIAKERIVPYRKDVLAKCYGGDVTRKRKLLEKQKEGKKKMKMVGNVEIPQEAFFSILSVKSGEKEE
ncbi:translation elongation factor 4 [Caldisericum exile]|uniref:Elongation factor 4 n=1 Tax=Caldisericum exile (strain DSM 21853 / NBRC 104410 / AZM16c01) TaxID=511051 RepID=A0A7U6JGT0_CALEA|nr:translation elongation factor 4 [Caldisericum exile]BAL80767.1 GTP-binding protein LepA [Caldisericum exile AZM16c01]